ncbi:MAG TPA: DNA-processing protein DprA [Rhizomicrobium sp.]|jgi:DNA processing protein
MQLSDRERRDWLRLARTPNVGPVTFAALIARFGSAARALDAIPKLARRGGASKFDVASAAEVEAELESLATAGGCMIASCEPEFPSGLAALDPPPPMIAVLGDPVLFQREMVAIVGARNASALGRKFAATLAADLGKRSVVVVSGMARGIDAAAHEASLKSGTVAVLAGGVDNIYPPENAPLYERLRNEGAIVSEMPLATTPQARHFPRRNRIISGMSRGVVVVEAAKGSGSLITANYALEQGREVFAVPGSPLDPRARGTNRLIREGATLVESADDVFSVLKPMLGSSFAEPEREPHVRHGLDEDLADADLTALREAVLELLAYSPVEVDDLVRQTGAAVTAVLAALLDLELAGRVQRHPGNRVSLA